jgi:hypothetical protein
MTTNLLTSPAQVIFPSHLVGFLDPAYIRPPLVDRTVVPFQERTLDKPTA